MSGVLVAIMYRLGWVSTNNFPPSKFAPNLIFRDVRFFYFLFSCNFFLLSLVDCNYDQSDVTSFEQFIVIFLIINKEHF